MAVTPAISQLIDDMQHVDSSFEQPSCVPGEPFVKYPDTGTPPVIDFNVPQNTAFTTYGHILKYFAPSVFKSFTKQVPANNYYDMVKTMTTEQATQLFHPNVLVHHSPIVGHVRSTAAHAHLSAHSPINTAGLHMAPLVHTTSATVPHLSAHNTVMAAQTLHASNAKLSLKAEYAMQQLRPLDIKRFNGLSRITKYVYRPPVPVPRIIIIEEYTTKSYLGNYGAGRVVKTMSLMPGEETTISVRTYKDKVSTVESSKNILDSFSESSAKELETLLQHEQGNISSTSDTSGGSGNSYSTTTDSKNSSKAFNISGGLSLGPLSIGGGYGKSQTETTDSSSGFSSTYDYNHSAARTSNVNALSSAINKSVQQSNANRSIDINTSTSDTARSGEEDSTVRLLKNINLNHTLNFTFRQLLQEYTVITYLSNLKFAYTNGYPESYTVVDINNLVNMLTDIIEPAEINNVLCKLLQPYCNVRNYTGDPANLKQFVMKVEVPFNNCLDIQGCTKQGSDVFYSVNNKCTDTYSDSVIKVGVNGVILSVQKQTLQTSSLIADSLLGRGDALDCFNQKAQQATNNAAFISNLQALQQLEDSAQNTANNQQFADQQIAMGDQKMDVITQQKEVIQTILNTPDALSAATHYKRVFGDCCDVPQSCCGGGCGCDCDKTTP